MLTQADLAHIEKTRELVEEKLDQCPYAMEEFTWMVTKLNELNRLCRAYQQRAVVLAGALKEML